MIGIGRRDPAGLGIGGGQRRHLPYLLAAHGAGRADVQISPLTEQLRKTNGISERLAYHDAQGRTTAQVTEDKPSGTPGAKPVKTRFFCFPARKHSVIPDVCHASVATAILADIKGNHFSAGEPLEPEVRTSVGRHTVPSRPHRVSINHAGRRGRRRPASRIGFCPAGQMTPWWHPSRPRGHHGDDNGLANNAASVAAAARRAT